MASNTNTKHTMQSQIYEWGGSLTGLAGAAVLAVNTKISKYGWWLFLLANLFMIAFALQGNHLGLLVQQCGFTLTSIIGIVRSSGKPLPKTGTPVPIQITGK